MIYAIIIDFNDFYDDLNDVWSTRLQLPNGAVIAFWKCKIKYVNSNESHYLKITSAQKQNISECLILLSFFTTLPLFTFEYNFEKTEEILDERQLENPSVSEWLEKLSTIERKLNYKKNRNHSEEQFFMYFKPIERVAKLQLDNTKILTGFSNEARKNLTKTFLEQLFLSNFDNTFFDQETLTELAGELNSTLNNSLERKNHRRIVLALSSITNNLDDGDSTKSTLLKIDSNRVQELVKIRNDIAHGNKVNVSPDDLIDVEYLSRQLITLVFFGINFKQVYLRSKKFNTDFWS
ncbi:hypothetical protein D2908_01115 [Streptococcus sp. LQJ-218]|uniref:HEPN domain-containing protein n=1 Tax=Streptococcus sp. LQJ-218 TaxID=2283190 RepID=UPI000E3EAF3D|nr:HEPN domain-containing protein [Streptococcus sp. LQJ-218]TAA68610.1 hypothetical protein D2908_01115 [Streptococcus sp. LQJ-218]